MQGFAEENATDPTKLRLAKKRKRCGGSKSVGEDSGATGKRANILAKDRLMT